MDAKARKQEEKRRKKEAQTRWWLWVFLPLFAVAILSLPGTLGIYDALVPGRGPFVSAIAAIGFELFYIFAAFLIMKDGLHRSLLNLVIAALVLASILNVLADYRYRVPYSLDDFDTLFSTFNGLAFLLALVEGISLAGLAFAGAFLMKFYHEVKPSPLAMTVPEPVADILPTTEPEPAPEAKPEPTPTSQQESHIAAAGALDDDPQLAAAEAIIAETASHVEAVAADKRPAPAASSEHETTQDQETEPGRGR
jgi:hypothetical protein